MYTRLHADQGGQQWSNCSQCLSNCCRVVQAVCGGTHTTALTDAGRIFIWGRGSFGAF